jgi:hypothetical protein
MSSTPFAKTARAEEEEDRKKQEQYAKGFTAMTTITGISAIAIVTACLLYKTANCDNTTTAAPASGLQALLYKLTCKIIGSEYDPESPGLLGCILFSLAFGWFVILSMFLLDTRPMLDLFSSTEALKVIKSYIVYPFLAVTGIVLVLGIVAFIPAFGLHRFVDQKAINERGDTLPFSDNDSIITRIVRRLQLVLPFRRLYSNLLNLIKYATTVSMLSTAVFVILLTVLFLIYVSKTFTDGIMSILRLFLVVIAVIVAVAVLITIYDAAAKKEKEYESMQSNSIILLVLKVIRYIPCMIIDAINWVRREYSITTRPVWILLGIEVVVIGAYFLVPMILNAAMFSETTKLTEDIVDLKTSKQLSTLGKVGIVRTPECSSKTKTKYDYAVSGWVFLSSHPPSMTSGGNKFVNVLDFNGIPTIEYNASTNELRFRIKVRVNTGASAYSTTRILTETEKTSITNTASRLSDVVNSNSVDDSVEEFENMFSSGGSSTGGNAAVDNEIESTAASASATKSVLSNATKGASAWVKTTLSKPDASVKTRAPPESYKMVTIHTISNVPLQRWNHFVYNYDGSNIDIFMNNELVVTVNDRLPLMEHGNITSGAKRGIIGNLTNVVAFSHHLTKDVISAIYMKEDPRGPVWSTYSKIRIPELMSEVGESK